MKILLIGNYENNRQQSMQRYANIIYKGMLDAGVSVTLAKPPVILGNLVRSDNGIGKWLGYIDRFILFLPILIYRIRQVDLVHICDQANAVYIPNLRGKPNLITCHDMLAIRAARGEITREIVRWSGRLYQRWILSRLRKANHIVCVSNQTRNDVARLGNIKPDRLTIIHNPLNYPYHPMSVDDAAPYLQESGVHDPYFFHVGGNQWYKNREGVLEIFALIKKLPQFTRHRLVMAGKPWTGTMRKRITKLNLEYEVIELIDISDEKLRALYSCAEALIFPSWQEGFGWPVIEAQACGCVVITTNRAPMNEIAGDSAIYIDPDDVNHAARIIDAGLQKSVEYQEAGLRNSVQFSSKTTIQNYINLYDRLISESVEKH